MILDLKTGWHSFLKNSEECLPSPIATKKLKIMYYFFTGASFFIIGLHASLLSSSDTPAITEELQMEEV